MSIATILYIVGAFVLGIVITWLFSGSGEQSGKESSKEVKKIEKKLSDKEFKIQQQGTQIHELQKQLDNAKTTNNEQSKLIVNLQQKLGEVKEGKGNSVDTSEIKQKYEKLLAEANSQCDKLSAQIKALSNGKGDNLSKQLTEESDKLRKEAESLKKKIIDLEDEIEENEDDISDLKKKISNKDSIIATTQEELSKEQKRSKQMAEDLSVVKDQLKEKVAELNLRIGSLAFIQEILSAKEFSAEDTKTLFRSIDYFESFVKNNFIDLNSYLFNKYGIKFQGAGGTTGLNKKRQFYSDGFDQWASTKRKSWLDGKTTIAFVGEFSAGKTSIVNRILSQDRKDIPLLPVSTKATTAIPTYIAGGPIVSYSFISGDGKRKVIPENTFKMVSKEILEQVKGVSALIKYFVMTYKNPNLEGLSILDTPGFNSNDKEDRDRTIDVINECDALFWVFDVNAGTVNRSSISVIKEKLNKPLYVVINKIDTKSASEVQKVENLIRKTLSDEGLSIQGVIRFSSQAPLADIMTPIKSVTKNTARDTFVADVGNDIDQLISGLKAGIKKKNTEYNDAVKQGNDLNDYFFDSIRVLKSNCASARDTPHFETHIFHSDKYEMSIDEYHFLEECLDLIADDNVSHLDNAFRNRMTCQETITQAWNELSEIRHSLAKVEECKEQYKKLTKNLKNNGNN